MDRPNFNSYLMLLNDSKHQHWNIGLFPDHTKSSYLHVYLHRYILKYYTWKHKKVLVYVLYIIIISTSILHSKVIKKEANWYMYLLYVIQSFEPKMLCFNNKMLFFNNNVVFLFKLLVIFFLQKPKLLMKYFILIFSNIIE